MANNLQNTNPTFFEGCEKLVEIWFAPNANADLRKIPRWSPYRGKILREEKYFPLSALILASYRFFLSHSGWRMFSRILENLPPNPSLDVVFAFRISSEWHCTCEKKILIFFLQEDYAIKAYKYVYGALVFVWLVLIAGKKQLKVYVVRNQLVEKYSNCNTRHTTKSN